MTPSDENHVFGTGFNRTSSRAWVEARESGERVDYMLTVTSDANGDATGVVTVDWQEETALDGAGVQLWMQRWMDQGMQMMPLPHDPSYGPWPGGVGSDADT